MKPSERSPTTGEGIELVGVGEDAELDSSVRGKAVDKAR
jgi:hypothetical protein